MSKLPSLITEQVDALGALCRDHHVVRLELFGSAAEGRFDADSSDLDFLVEFMPLAAHDRADAYFGLLDALNQLFGRRVDLIELGAVDNPFFRQAIDQSRTLLYAA
ncbi:MAG TPA: nucleotidyltransferase domain-containing protein [Lacipirellulaceae bacterium]|nr:nucleotidyltransferase domain-containing protein [Lacipirellulaceae bacterium]HMP07781.1 nucleotidyltransferase domain-containing protein [Lacipirellulaceae bacterium]